MVAVLAAAALAGVSILVITGWDGSTYEIEGDVVMVNNRRCAMSGAPIPDADRGRWQSRVQYDGPLEHLRGKTLVFNQCCAECIDSFPVRWQEARDQIVHAHGLDR